MQSQTLDPTKTALKHHHSAELAATHHEEHPDHRVFGLIIFLVELKVKPTNNFKIYLDADSGLGIEKCIKINRALYKQMDEMGMYPDGDFSLEVSSAGIDEPFKQVRQYKKNVGRTVSVVMQQDDLAYEGELTEATDEAITLQYTEGKGKHAATKTVTLLIEAIKQTKVLIKF